jgi:hypothetical protein
VPSYRPRPGMALEDAAQFDGTDLAPVAGVAARAAGATLTRHDLLAILTVPGWPPRAIVPGDWLSWDGQALTVHADESFRRWWEPAS